MVDRLRVMVEPKKVVVSSSGEPAHLDVRVFNLSSIIDAFVVEATGQPDWLRVTPTEVRLLPKSDGTVQLPVSIASGRLVAASDLHVRIQARSRSSPGDVESEWVEVSIPARDVPAKLTLEPRVVRGGGSAHLQLLVDNGDGNRPLRLALGGSDPESVVRFHFNPPLVQVPAGGRARAGVAVEGPRPMRGQEVSRQLIVHASDGQQEVSTAGTFVQESAITEGRRTGLRMLLTLLGAFAMALGAFMPWTNAPFRVPGVAWTFFAFASVVRIQVPPLRDDIAAIIPNILISAGMVVIVLAVLALLGLTGKGRLTRLASGLALAFLALFLAVLGLGPLGVTPASGAFMVAAGAITAFIGGLLATR